MLETLQQAFPKEFFDPSNTGFWVFIVAVIGVLLILYILFHLFFKKEYRFDPKNKVTSPQLIYKMLDEAMSQRRPFEIQIGSPNEGRRPTLRCSIEHLDRSSLTLEASGLKELSSHWINREVTVFFRITNKGAFSYHTFFSTIQKIQTPEKGLCHITLPMPTCIENRQQRSFLRIEPPRDCLLGTAFWYGDSMPEPEQINDLSLWPDPVLLHLPDYITMFTISDLSAGGMRIRIPQKIVKNISFKLSTVDRFVVMLDLFDPENNKKIRFWLQCRTQRIMVEPPTHDVHLGAQFIAWGKPRRPIDENVPGAIEWFRLSSSSEVEPICNWIARRHLAMHRRD